MVSSVTRLGDFLHFVQLFKAFGTINLLKSFTFFGNFCKVVKIFHFLVKSVLGNFYRHLAIFYLVKLMVSIMMLIQCLSCNL